MSHRVCIDCSLGVIDDSLRLCPECLCALPFPESYSLKDVLADAGLSDEEVALFLEPESSNEQG